MTLKRLTNYLKTEDIYLMRKEPISLNLTRPQ